MLKKIIRFFRASYISKKTNERMKYPRCTFLGDTMSLSFTSLFFWENVLSNVEFARFIELGTSSGTLSVYFCLFCLNKGAEFFTFDIKKDYSETKIKLFIGFDAVFKSHNVLDDPKFVREMVGKDGLSILFCDNGNKSLEFELFAPCLKKGDFICVHDWNVEIDYKTISGVAKKNNLEMIYKKLSLDSYSHIRIFEKR